MITVKSTYCVIRLSNISCLNAILLQCVCPACSVCCCFRFCLPSMFCVLLFQILFAQHVLCVVVSDSVCPACSVCCCFRFCLPSMFCVLLFQILFAQHVLCVVVSDSVCPACSVCCCFRFCLPSMFCVLLFQILSRYIRECYTQFLEGADTFEDLEAELARRLGSVTFSLEDRTYQASQQNLSLEIQFNSNLEFNVCSFPL